MIEPFTPAWWFGSPNPATAAALWAFAAVAVAWLRYDATVWADAAKVARRRLTPRGFAANGWWCDRCSTYWATAPLIWSHGPVVWLAANGAYLIAAVYLPTLAPTDPHPAAPPDGVTEVTWGPAAGVNPERVRYEYPTFNEPEGGGV